MESTFKHFKPDTDWVAVDFDGTLHYRLPGAQLEELGPPVKKMVARVKKWLSEGKQVKLLTARVSDAPKRELAPEDVPAYVAHQRLILAEWCKEHIGQELPMTASKDVYMYQLWDDRAVAIEGNTGKILGNPEFSAGHGKMILPGSLR